MRVNQQVVGRINRLYPVSFSFSEIFATQHDTLDDVWPLDHGYWLSLVKTDQSNHTKIKAACIPAENLAMILLRPRDNIVSIELRKYFHLH